LCPVERNRDKALKECNDLREKFGEYTAKEESTREGLKARFHYNSYSRECDNSREDQTEILKSTRHMYGKTPPHPPGKQLGAPALNYASA
jgi:hypothetical protein